MAVGQSAARGATFIATRCAPGLMRNFCASAALASSDGVKKRHKSEMPFAHGELPCAKSGLPWRKFSPAVNLIKIEKRLVVLGEEDTVRTSTVQVDNNARAYTYGIVRILHSFDSSSACRRRCPLRPPNLLSSSSTNQIVARSCST